MSSQSNMSDISMNDISMNDISMNTICMQVPNTPPIPEPIKVSVTKLTPTIQPKPNSNPYIVDELNLLINELNNLHVKNYETDVMYHNIMNQYQNYMTDISFTQDVDKLAFSLAGSYNYNNNRSNINNEKQISVNQYYSKLYEKEITIIKKVIFMCCIGLIGCLLFNKKIISDKTFTFYLGVVFSVCFILIFYDLWDLYIRDDTNFDEYNYNIYYKKRDISNNITDETVHPMNFDSSNNC